MTRLWEHHEWVEPYRAAVLEMNSTEAAVRISAAKSTIEARIADTNAPPGEQELYALQHALRMLRLLEKQRPSSDMAS